MTHDLLSYLNINIGTQSQFYHDTGLAKYSIMTNGFTPALSSLGLDPSSTFAKMLNIALLSTYVLLSLIGFSYSLIFHFFCIGASYEKKWSGINKFIYSIVRQY